MRKCRFTSNNPNRGIPGDNAPDTDFFFHCFDTASETGAVAIIEDPTGRIFEVRATNINFVSPPEEGTATERLLAKLLQDRIEEQALENLFMPAPTRREREIWKERNFAKHYGATKAPVQGKEADRVGVLGNRVGAMYELFGKMFEGRDVEPLFGSPEWLEKYRPRENNPVVFGMDFGRIEENVLLEEAGRRFFEQVLPWLDEERAKYDFDELPFFQLYVPRPGHLRISHERTDKVLEVIWTTPKGENGLNVSGAWVDEALHLHKDNPEATNGDFNEETVNRGHVPGQVGKPLDWDSLPTGDGEQK